MGHATLYDDVRYASRSFPQAQPGRLSTLAHLFGMNPADPSHARVLELGCGDGSNLLPVAYAWPDARVVGVDLSAAAIGDGRRSAEQLGLRNLDLRVGDLSRLPDDLGEFDYVIAHGVYSWVSEPVRQALLGACRRLLAPQGVAYISYNVLPGGHLRRMLREMLLMHVEEIEQPDRRCAAARELLAFLQEGTAGASERRDVAALADEAERLAKRGDYNLLHDDIAAEFHLCHFRDFVEQCEAHGLQFLAEADYFEMSDAGLSAPARDRLGALAGDLVAREQYLDFVKVRRFRQSLLCRSEIELRDAGATTVRGLALASAVQPGAGSIATNSPLLKTVLELLSSEWPKAIPFDEAFKAAVARCGLAESERGREELSTFALRAHAVGAVELYASQPRFERWPGPRPRASALACLQANAGPVITNLLGAPISIEDPRARSLLLSLDGHRDRSQLMRKHGGSAQELERDLEVLGRAALLLPANA